MSEVAKALNRVGEAVEAHNERVALAERDADLRAMRDFPRVLGAMRRGLVVNMVRNGLFHTAIPREAWRDDGNEVVVKCNCGAEHRFKAVAGEIERSDCGRDFLYDGGDVRVARPPS